MSKKYALNYPAQGKIAIGPLSFKVDSQMVLHPQPTEEQITRLKIGGYLRTVEVPDLFEEHAELAPAELPTVATPALEKSDPLAEFETSVATDSPAPAPAPPDQKRGKGKK